VLEELAQRAGLPQVLVLDNGPEFTSKAMLCWAEQRGVKLHFIDPGKPMQNAYINQHWLIGIAFYATMGIQNHRFGISTSGAG
jgi:transposase InsO family protein